MPWLIIGFAICRICHIIEKVREDVFLGWSRYWWCHHIELWFLMIFTSSMNFILVDIVRTVLCWHKPDCNNVVIEKREKENSKNELISLFIIADSTYPRLTSLWLHTCCSFSKISSCTSILRCFEGVSSVNFKLIVIAPNYSQMRSIIATRLN